MTEQPIEMGAYESEPLERRRISPLILLGGEQKRFKDTLSTPKSLVELGGEPLLDLWLKKMERAHLGRILLGVAHPHDTIEQHVRSSFKENQQPIFSYDSEQRNGTGGAFLEAARTLLDSTDQQTILSMNGDTIVSADLERMLNAHEQHRTETGGDVATITLTTEGTHHIDQVYYDTATKEIAAWNEGINDAPDLRSGHLKAASNTGISLIDRSILERILHDFQHRNGRISFEQEILRYEVRYGKFFAHVGKYPMINLNEPADLDRLRNEEGFWKQVLTE